MVSLIKVSSILLLLTTLYSSEDNTTQSGGSFWDSTKAFVEILWNAVNAPLFSINDSELSILKILFSLTVIIAGSLVGKYYKKYIQRSASVLRVLNGSNRIIIANLGYYIIILVAFFMSLKILGLNLSSIALIAGALSVGIGFGLQNVVSNFVSGLILMFERSIKIGDYIELSDQLRGHVTDIRMRSTTINTNSNIDVIVPNQDLIQKQVINWTMNDDIRRFDISFSVAYGTDPELVMKVILEAINKSDFEDLYSDHEKQNRVVMTDMGDSGVNFELFVWIKGREILNNKKTTSRFLVLIYKTLYAHNISIPFPQRDLHLRSVEENLLGPLKVATATHDKI